MMRAGFEMRHAVLLQFRLEPAGAAPAGVLAAVIGEHLLGRLELAHRQPQAALADVQFLADQGQTEPFLNMQLYGFQLFRNGETPRIFRAASPPRGGSSSSSLRLLLHSC